MKKNFFLLLIFSLFISCSFDNKTGIWRNENSPSQKEISKGSFAEFKTLSTSNNTFNKEILLKENFKFKLTNANKNNNWEDIFFNKNNNLANFSYNKNFKLQKKGKKISKHKLSDYLLYENKNLIISDIKGNIIIYSIENGKILQKFNFYKNKYKKISKNLNLILENNIIYVSDNIGFLYAYDYISNKVLWAKNFKIPFRSNLKIVDDKILAANQNNSLYIINKKSGDNLKLIPTEETIIKNDFINNLSVSQNNLYFLNTYGSLYSIEVRKKRISWFINLNQSLELNPSNLFFGNQVVLDKNKIVISSSNFTYVLEKNNGAIIYKKNFSSIIKPIINNDYLFLLTKNYYLIAMNLKNGEILFSYDINNKIANFLETKKNIAQFQSMAIINSGILIFLKNSYVLQLNINGKIQRIAKLPSKMRTFPIFIDGKIIYADQNNKIAVLN